MKIHYSVQVSKEAARLTRATLIGDRIEHQREQYKKIPAYLALLHTKNPLIVIDLHTIYDADSGIDTFQHVFICPLQSQSSCIHMRKFMAVDGTFLKARFIQTIFLAVGIDGNGKNLLLA